MWGSSNKKHLLILSILSKILSLFLYLVTANLDIQSPGIGNVIIWGTINYVAKENLCYDIVISRHFIEHVFNPFEYLNDFGKVLKTKGLLIENC